MKHKYYFLTFTMALLFLFTNGVFTFAQSLKFPTPREKQLLNDLKLLTWDVPEAEKVTIKLRIHKGSAFDQQNKEGTMALLGEILFPGKLIKESFEEDFGGSLEIITTYDYLQINIVANKAELLNVLEILANAVTNPLIDKENTDTVKKDLLAKLKTFENDPGYFADKTVKEKLFGDFPYGRLVFGTTESINKIDFADIIFARQKFLTADNATLAVIGDIDSNLVYRATRRYFGNWVKADEKIPAYFTLPEINESGVTVKASSKENTSELRYIFRGLARKDENYFASNILAKILQNRLNENGLNKFKVYNSAHFLPGYVLVSATDWNLGKISHSEEKISLPGNIDSFVSDSLNNPVSEEEFLRAKVFDLPNDLNKYSDWWLDADTYGLASVKDQYKIIQKTSLADIEKVAEKWRKQPIVGILVFKGAEKETESVETETDQ